MVLIRLIIMVIVQIKYKNKKKIKNMNPKRNKIQKVDYNFTFDIRLKDKENKV